MKTEILVTVDHSHPMPDLADQVSARAWTLAGVNSVEGRLAAQAAPTEVNDTLIDALRKAMTAAAIPREDRGPLIGFFCNELNAQAAQSSQAPVVQAVQAVQAKEYPPLPQPAHRGPSGTGTYFDAFTADQMHAYLDADRASSGATTQAVRMLTPEEPEKCYSLDEETFFDLDELIDMLDEEQAKPGFLVYEGESVRHAASHYARGAVADLFERMGEQAFDDAGEHIGDWPDHAVKGDNSAELEKLIYDWLDANVKVHFYTVKNVRQIALTADMLGDDDAGRTIPPSGEIVGAV